MKLPSRWLRYVFLGAALLFGPAAWCQDSSAAARFLIINSPENPVVFVNGREYSRDFGGWYDVPAGDIRLEILSNGAIVYSSGVTLAAGEEKAIMLGCRVKCAGFKVNSDPDGAALSVDGEPCGRTPFINRFMQPGDHTLLLLLHGYAPKSAAISLKPDTLRVFKYKLDHSQEYRDSVALAVKLKKRARQRVRKIFFVSLAGAFGCAGAGFDYKAYSENARADAAAAEYAGAKGGFAGIKDTYSQQRSNAQKSLEYRNILYGAAGACMACFCFSFVF